MVIAYVPITSHYFGAKGYYYRYLGGPGSELVFPLLLGGILILVSTPLKKCYSGVSRSASMGCSLGLLDVGVQGLRV